MTKHIAIRTCAVTREKHPKSDLVRIAVVDGNLVIDTLGSVRSRGVNIKPDIEILKLGIKRNIFKKVYNIPFTQEQYDRLISEFNEYLDIKFREKKVFRVSIKEISNE